MKIFAILVSIACIILSNQANGDPLRSAQLIKLSAEKDLESKAQPLGKDWNVVWKQFETPDQIKDLLSKNSDPINLPYSWSIVLEPEKTYGLFYKVIRFPDDFATQSVAIKIDRLSSAIASIYDLERNELLALDQNGKPSQEATHEIPGQNKILLSWYAKPATDYLVLIQLSNHHYHKGGFYTEPEIANREIIENNHYTETLLNTCLVGSVVVIGIYHLMIFFLGRSNYSALIFSLLCFSALMRVSMSSRFLQMMGIGQSIEGFEIFMKIELGSLIFITVSGQKFFDILIQENLFLRKLTTFMAVIGLGLVSWVIFGDLLQVSHHLLLIQIYMLFGIFASLMCLGYSAYYDQGLARPVLFAMIISSVGMVNDHLYFMKVIETKPTAHFTFMVFLLLQSYIISARSARAHAQAKHSFKQLAKVFYPHQIKQIEKGQDLEETMNTDPGEGIVISFDIIGSAKIKHPRVKQFMESAVHGCMEILHNNYDPIHLKANGYRIKEMGDGFLCSIGYPFAIPDGSSETELSLRLAMGFIKNLEEKVREFSIDDKVCCAIGMAQGNLQGYFPTSGTKEYDLFGRGIVLASRYESLRKRIELTNGYEHVIIVHSKVANRFSDELKDRFTRHQLKGDLKVRDDETASDFYYRSIPFDETTDSQETTLKAS